MRHTKESKLAAAGLTNDLFDGLRISSAPFSCAYATVMIHSNLERHVYSQYTVDPKTGYGKYNEAKPQIQVMREWVAKYRKPILFTGMRHDLGVLDKEKLEVFHKKGKYLDIQWLMDTETWHGDYMVDLFKLEVIDESVPRRPRRKSAKV